ncbi:serine hydrolase domain-containing protein [Thiorhodovibrio winogradskyi]|nr:serine hydrolase domain-containing protein [Thiorhodovibrio winogradskyi]
MRIAIFAFITALSAFLLGAVAQTQATCPEPAHRQTDSVFVVRQHIHAAMPGLLERYQVPGAAVVLVQDGEPNWSHGYGLAIPDRQIPVDPATTLFQAASVSKPVTALTVLTLVRQGRVALDQAILPQLQGNTGSWRLPASSYSRDAVTLARVLSHTAGLSVPGYGGFPPGTPAQSLLDSLHGAADAGNTPLKVVQPPGQGFRYSGGGYSLLQLLIREWADEPFATAAAHRILEPLAMTNSRFPTLPSASPPLAATFNDQGQRAPARHFTALAAAGLQTTATDLARLLTLLMPGHRGEVPGRGVLQPALIDRLLTPMPHSDNDLVLSGSRYGLGMALYELDSGRRLAYHPGDNLPNWHNLIAAIPERRVGLVVMTNAAGGRALRKDLLCLWLDALNEAHPEGRIGGGCASVERIPMQVIGET